MKNKIYVQRKRKVENEIFVHNFLLKPSIVKTRQIEVIVAETKTNNNKI